MPSEESGDVEVASRANQSDDGAIVNRRGTTGGTWGRSFRKNMIPNGCSSSISQSSSRKGSRRYRKKEVAGSAASFAARGRKGTEFTTTTSIVSCLTEDEEDKNLAAMSDDENEFLDNDLGTGVGGICRRGTNTPSKSADGPDSDEPPIEKIDVPGTPATACSTPASTPAPVTPFRGGRPIAGCSTRELPLDANVDDVSSDPEESEENQKNENVAGKKPEEGEEKKPAKNAWRKLPGKTLNVRSTEFTKRNRHKVPSPGELYECVTVDVLESASRMPNISSRVDVSNIVETGAENDTCESPAIASPSDAAKKTWVAPDVFVVTLSLPQDPNAGGTDGPSFTIVMYFAMKASTREILARITAPDYEDAEAPSEGRRDEDPHVTAARLFDEWCRKSPTDPKFQARFKLIPVLDFDDIEIPGWMLKYNGKPMLIKRTGKSGFFYPDDPNCMEMEISLYPMPWAFKQILQYYLQNVLHKSSLTLGFVVEAREDSELPEVLIGLCQLCRVRASHAMSAAEFFSSNAKGPVKLKTLHSGEW